jgi:hypothetical protein
MSRHVTAHSSLAGAIGLLSAPAWSQAVTFADLDGFVIEANIIRDQVVRREGSQFLTENNVRWRVVIGPGDAIENTASQTSHTVRGEHKSRPRTNAYVLGVEREEPSQGGGIAVWEFNDGTLTYMRTFSQGAYRADFAIARDAAGLTCTVTDSFGREDGRGALVMESVIDGSEVTIIRTQPVSSNCRVVKREAP